MDPLPEPKWVWRQGHWLGGDCSIERHHLPKMMHNATFDAEKTDGDIAIVPNWSPDGQY